MKIAVIDDNPVNLQLISALAHGASGFKPICFEDSKEGLAWCLENEVDIILVDYMMPDIDGCQFIEAIRKEPRFNDTPIVMITAADAPEIRKQALQLGATEFLSKPIDNAEFKARVKNLCELRYSRKALSLRAEDLEEQVQKATAIIHSREVELLLRLSRAIDSRVRVTHDRGYHAEFIGHLCAAISMGLGLDYRYQERIIAAASTHDIGFITLPDALIGVSPSTMSSDDFIVYQKHTTSGHHILEGSRSELAQLAAEIALNHHERWDGQGYPSQLRGESIPLSARICAVAHDFNELLEFEQLSPKAALQRIIQASATAYDPRCVQAFSFHFPMIESIITQFTQ